MLYKVFNLVYTRQQAAESNLSKLTSEHERIVQIEKMSAMGELVGEIAHQLNNPLVGVINLTQLAEREVHDPRRVSELLAEVRKAGTECRDIVQRILRINQISRSTLQPTDMQALVQDTITFCHQSIDLRHGVDFTAPAEKIVLNGDPVLLRQALFNLIHNAVLAAPDAPVHVALALETREKVAGIRLSVTDSGPGFDSATAAKLFKPFFTTRPTGTGLGLSVAQHIVMKHGGVVLAENLPEGGARFSIWLAHADEAMKSKILLVDDDPFTRRLFENLFRGGPIELVTATNVAEARRAFDLGDFNLAILDQRLPDGNGLDLFAEMRRLRPRQTALMITGYAEVRDAMRAVREGLYDYLTKPFENLEELEAVIAKALEMDRAYREIADLKEILTSGSGDPILISHSVAMERLLAQLRQAAPLDTTVLIEGESGTGKEVIAKLLHSLSARTHGPMKELNCGAMSESLIEAALFGYERGAFTGAVKTTAGYFEEADNGTILLDEIADMSPKLQVSLLRVLQEGTFVRLGSTVQRPSNFRLICATNKPLDQEVAAGRFRSDLYYRINVVPLRVPAASRTPGRHPAAGAVLPGPLQPQIQQERRALAE